MYFEIIEFRPEVPEYFQKELEKTAKNSQLRQTNK